MLLKLCKIVAALAISCSAIGQSTGVIEVYSEDDTVSQYFVRNAELFNQQWDTLAQPNFWKEVMALSPDSCILNVAATRRILFKTSFIEWRKQTDAQKSKYKDSVRKEYCIETGTKLYVTSGKNHFYNFEGVLPSISKGVELFQEFNTDPWFAQAILLIESPGKVAYSSVGAYGPFQLMKSVARHHGLKVNKYVDERKDFAKSAKGAAHLIRTSCIPEARRILKKNGLTFNETDLWFRLFVLHIYHAGAGNVDGLITSIDPDNGGMELITTMWQSEWGGFKNASQNYTQVALASQMILNDMIMEKSKYIYECYITHD
ncbi:MAG: transglycosylase SLT domain-containing protein [Flavobacteriales bacterium]|nr:transglycosylase SLT domain-containing protein [Flavobacteriales bacterium]